MLRAWPVAASSSVSLVEVSPSTVMQLKIAGRPGSGAPAGSRPESGVGRHEGQHCRHVGAIMPEPFGDAVDGDHSLADHRRARSPVSGKVSVVMMAAAASAQASARKSLISAGRLSVIFLSGRARR